MLTTEQREIRNAELVRQRMFGATVRQIAKSSGLAKSHVHRLVRDVLIVAGHHRRKPEKPTVRCCIVPCADGLGYCVVTMPA
jgi:hypothetical protein